MRLSPRWWIGMVVPLPSILVGAILCADTVARGRLLWPTTRVSLADAIVLRNAGEATSQLRNGVDPNTPSLLLEASRRGRPRRVLPAEAAVLSGEVRFLDLLAAHGARFDEPLLVRLYCEADRAGENELRKWFEMRLGRPAACDR